MIPVPSKLYHLDEDRTKTKKPLAGLRFGVKDSIDVAGLHTGNGSKDYREMYPPRSETAHCVELLIEAGAMMVGKLRCSQWCDTQEPADR
jgi:Asp-tRNA(Asn)/Glu-tRNA(Gln) amidotransferase A subunit family amidase